MFSSLFGQQEGEAEVVLDLKGHLNGLEITKEQAEIVANFIGYYDSGNLEKLANAFKTYKSYKDFQPVA